MTELATRPKIELHLHLEGAAPLDFVRDLAAEKRMDLSSVLTEDGYRWRNFTEFLEAYMAVAALIETPEETARLTAAVLAASARAGVVYTEIALCPDITGKGDAGAWAEHLAALGAAAAAAEARDGITARIIATAIRNSGGDAAERAAATAASSLETGLVVGFGLAGEERMGHPQDFARAFDRARDAGLGLTAHAGELAGPESVAAALRHLKPSRIGHGVRAIEDPALVRHLAEHRVTLEVCPGSNIALGLYPSLDQHPIERLRQAGVPVTVSTDDPPFFRTDLLAEYRGLEAAFGWGGQDFARQNHLALDAAFCDAATRARIRERLDA